MDFNNPLPKRLKEARLREKISQKTLGINIGLDPSSASGRMNHYEKGRHTPDLQTLKRIAKELNVPLNYFFCENNNIAEINLLIHKLEEEEIRELKSIIESKYDKHR